MSDDVPEKKCEAGLPAWLATFADLMSLLMCFFVLLLSFAEMDIEKFKQVAGSMKLAFGVQRQVKADDVPKGTSIIAREFTSGRPEPTPLNEVKQRTMDDTKQTLEFSTSEEMSDTENISDPASDVDADETDAENITDPSSDIEVENPNISQADVAEIVTKETLDNVKKMQLALKQELDAGLIEMEREGNTIMVRIKDKASFPSGQANLRTDFLPVLRKLGGVLDDLTGNVVVAGHTDDIPIKTARFHSNWELSASRAASVVHQILGEGVLDKSRFVVEGHGDAHPLVPNDSPENRAKNRRVELTIVQRPLQQNDEEGQIPVDEVGSSLGGQGASTTPDQAAADAEAFINELESGAAELPQPGDAAGSPDQAAADAEAFINELESGATELLQPDAAADAQPVINELEEATGLKEGETTTITIDDGEKENLRQLTPQELLNLGNG